MRGLEQVQWVRNVGEAEVAQEVCGPQAASWGRVRGEGEDKGEGVETVGDGGERGRKGGFGVVPPYGTRSRSCPTVFNRPRPEEIAEKGGVLGQVREDVCKVVKGGGGVVGWAMVVDVEELRYCEIAYVG